MGPAYGTPEYEKQVETIYKLAMSSAITPEELNGFLILYIMDESFARGAICEAEKKIQRDKFKIYT